MVDMTYDPELIRRLGAAVADPERVEPSLDRGRRRLRLYGQIFGTVKSGG